MPTAPVRNATGIRTAEVVLPCIDLDPTVDFFVDQLGLRLDVIMPADDPAVAALSGHGLRIRLERGGTGDPGELRLACDDPRAWGTDRLTAPNGTRIQLVDADPPLMIPDSPPLFELTRDDGDVGGVGRAGMRYRDLLPKRQGGRFIASHILIPEAGPVPDYVHHHRVRFQLIYCAAGWVRVVYEDQGPAFVLQPGDCVLQPPGIRHRVLESSAGLEVVEIGCPAEHETTAEHLITLPTPEVRPDRVFEGQRFVRHAAADAVWQRWRSPGFECRDTGIGDATDGLGGVRVVRRAGEAPQAKASGGAAGETASVVDLLHDGELLFWFLLAGTATLHTHGRPAEPLAKGAAVAVPAGLAHRLSLPSADLELLEVTLPAVLELRPALC
ncbi:MAG: AraC family ligand binding domain-containing protein [Actinomycetota bacterium]|nr:AraC family ligand binding domain-containing protein [Actinomycetota bacterium]